MADLAAFIDEVYEAAVVPELWPKVLDGLTEIGDGFCALMFTGDGEFQRSIESQTATAIMADYFAGGWHLRNDRAARLFATRHAGFLTDLDVFTQEEIDRELIFTEFLHPRGFGWGMATAISVPTGEMIAFDVERKLADGPAAPYVAQRLDELRPHLARASLLTTKLRHERAKAAVQSLEMIGLPAAVIAASQRPLAMNARLQSMVPYVVQDRQSRIALADTAADALLANALEQMRGPWDQRISKSIPILAKDNRPPYIVHLIPVRGVANDVFGGSLAIMVVTPVAPKDVPGADVLQGLFDLTAAETRITRALAAQGTVASIAADFGLSPETVRTHLKRVMSKTGTTRQAELTALLSGVVL
jgi:DNA-binding CsgD family transcriptional regulator